MRKKLFAILMSALMMVSFMPAMAFAGEDGPVAKIGTTEYATLAEAITAAEKNTEPITITILRNFSEALNRVQHYKGSFTIDLNGKQVTLTEAALDLGGTKTITDSMGGGKIYREAGAPVSVECNQTDANITISGGTFSTKQEEEITSNSLYKTPFGVTCSGQTGNQQILNITGGIFEGFNACEGVYNISGGIFKGWFRTNDKDKMSEINISGGDFTESVFKYGIAVNYAGTIMNGFYPTDDEHKGPTIAITGGKFAVDPTAYVPSGYSAVKDAVQDIWTVVDNHVAQIGSEKYMTLQAAVDASKNMENATIKLLKDVEVTPTHTASNDYGALHLGNGYCCSGLIIDGQGHTVKLADNSFNTKQYNTISISTGTVTFKNLTVDANGEGNDTIKTQSKSAFNCINSTVICDNVTVKNTNGGWSAFNVNKSDVTLNNCTVTENVKQVISCDKGDETTPSIATINSGTYDGTIRVEGTNAYNVLNVKGGKFTFDTINENLKIDKAGGIIVITAGEFAADPHTFVNEGNTYLLNDKTLTTPYVVSATAPTHSSGMNTWTLNATTGLYEESYVAPPKQDPAPEKIEEAISIDVSKDVEVKKDETGVVAAKTEVNEKVAESIVEAAKTNKSEEVVIAAVAETKSTEAVTKAEVALPVKAIEELAKVETVKNVVIQTNVAEITLDKTTAEEIAKQAPEGATIIVEAVREDEKSDEVAQDVYELKIIAVQSGTKTEIGDFKGGKVTVKVDIPEGLTGKKVACLYRANNGKYTRRAVTKQDDAKGFFSFTTNHFSDYVVTEEATAQKLLVNQTGVKQYKAKKAGNKVKLTFKKATWDTELGKKVRTYQIYKATKKNGKFKKFATVTNKKNVKKITVTKKAGGKKCYYKIRGKIKLSNGKNAYTKWSAVQGA